MNGTLRSFDARADVDPDSRDFTEDLANEVTSELEPAGQPGLVPAPAPAPAVADARPGGISVGSLLRDRYLLEVQLGNGGTSTVYRAIDLRRDAGAADDARRVAIKLLRPELRQRAQSVARMQREFRQTMAIAHPNVVRFLDLDRDGDAWFIVMELLSGETLGPLLRRTAPAGLPAAEALRIACAVGEALAHAHGRAVVHGDVKPDNVFLTGAGDVRLFDFGVAPESAAQLPTDTNALPVAAAATRAYASPQVLGGEAPEPSDDVFSLGCVLHEMLSGQHPYGRHGADRARDSALVPVRLASLDSRRACVVAAALSLAREGRPGMAEFVRELQGDEGTVRAQAPAAQATLSVAPAVAPARVAAIAAPAPRRPGPALLVSIAACLALAVGILIGRFDAGEESGRAPSPEPSGVAAAQPQPPPMAEAPAEPEELPATRPMEPVPDEAEPAVEPPVAGGAPGLVFFDAPRMVVSNRALVAAIPLRHLNHERRAVSVNWRTTEGTARAGRDFGGPTSGVESFIEGNSFRILYVPIVSNPPATRDRTFTVELTAVSAGADLGPTSRVEVTILGGP